MKLLGFYLGHHDSNVAIYDGSRVRYLKSERRHQIKHHRATMDWVLETCRAADFKPDAVAFSDGNRNGLGICAPDRLWEPMAAANAFGRPVATFCIDHHFAHMLSAWPLRPLREIDYGVTIDGRGDHSRRVTIVRGPGTPEPELLLACEKRAYCRLFNLIGQAMGLRGLEVDFAGKVMGANAYGSVDASFVGANRSEGVARDPTALLTRIAWRGRLPADHERFFAFDSASFRDWLASVHSLLSDFIATLFERFVPASANVVYAGGAAQNTVFNERLHGSYPGLMIPPHCYDGGLALGCLEFLRSHFDLAPFPTEGFPFWQDDSDGGMASGRTISRVAEHIARGKLVGWFQGRGEIGPRALGHRSILFDARRPDAKDYLNCTVKRREHWRPYAGSVNEEFLHALCGPAAASPYMLRAMPVLASMRENVTAIVHHDGTSRLQTVAAGNPETASFHALIARLAEVSGVPAVLNTSMNADGKPIVSTPEDALELWRSTPLDVLCVGDRLWEK